MEHVPLRAVLDHPPTLRVGHGTVGVVDDFLLWVSYSENTTMSGDDVPVCTGIHREGTSV